MSQKHRVKKMQWNSRGEIITDIIWVMPDPHREAMKNTKPIPSDRVGQFWFSDYPLRWWERHPKIHPTQKAIATGRIYKTYPKRALKFIWSKIWWFILVVGIIPVIFVEYVLPWAFSLLFPYL